MQPKLTDNKWLAGYSYLLQRPSLMLVMVALLALLAVAGSRYFTFDASADTLVVQGDPELAFYRSVQAQFGGDEFLIMTLTAKEKDLFTPDFLGFIASLQAELEQLEGVRGVLSILDAPLLQSPPVPIQELTQGYKQLNTEGVDLALARAELLASPIFQDLLISKDGATTALRIDLEVEHELNALRQQRDHLQQAEKTRQTRTELAAVKTAYALTRADFLDRRTRLIANIRAIRTRHEDDASIHIGGVPMIASDMIRFVKSDIQVFGLAILLAMLLVLYWFFRRLIWVMLPLASAALANLLLIGLLGFAGQAATVISANFIALLAITTIALTVHLIIRYQELAQKQPASDHASLVFAVIRSKFAPCVYTALTTMVAFGSLLSSRIQPVEDFGAIMIAGIFCSIFVAFTFFPALLLFCARDSHTPGNTGHRLIQILATAATDKYRKILGFSAPIVILSLFGLTLLSLDNRFVDYFKAHTDISKGMLFVDQNLGGTIPFEVILSFPPWQQENAEPEVEDDFSFAADEDDAYPEKYWFTPDKMARIGALHKYIDERSETGKTLSLATLELVARTFNAGKPLDALTLVAVLDAIPAPIREEFLAPYARPGAGLVRISSRIIESGPAFSKKELMQGIERYATEGLGFAKTEVHTTGIMVIFNNMIEQLLRSQTNTIIYVVLAMLIMFLLLLRSLKLAIIGLLPNMLAAASVLAVMGYVGLPLDMMTITIAAISVGIGVDNAIHYLHRYKTEMSYDADARRAIHAAHNAVGPAMHHTSITVVLGFSILGLSNFVPNVTFGLLTALAMVLALFANLGLLPALLMAFTASGRRAQR